MHCGSNMGLHLIWDGLHEQLARRYYRTRRLRELDSINPRSEEALRRDHRQAPVNWKRVSARVSGDLAHHRERVEPRAAYKALRIGVSWGQFDTSGHVRTWETCIARTLSVRLRARMGCSLLSLRSLAFLD